MTKKHFKVIALIIRNSQIANKEGFVEELCILFKELNPRFDSQKFKDAVFVV